MTPEEQAHFRILRAFQENPDLTQRELSEKLGISLGRANFLIDALMEKGALKMERFRHSDTKLKKIAYILTPTGLAERVRLTQSYLEKKKAEYKALKAEIESIEKERQQAGQETQRGRA